MNSKEYWSTFKKYSFYEKSTIIDNINIYGENPRRRKFIAEYISSLNPTSVLEVGCMFGNNLKNIKIFNDLNNKSCKYTGCDINEDIVKSASDESIKFIHQDISIHTPDFVNTFDIVFSVGTLIHIPLEEIWQVVKNLKQYSTKYIIHFEEHGKLFYQRQRPLRRFVSNYEKLYEEYRVEIISAKEFDFEQGGGFDHIIKITK